MPSVRDDLRVNAEGLRVFAKQMRALAPKLGLAETQALRAIGDKVRDDIRSSTARPYGPIDSKGQVGRKRRSMKTSATQRGVALYSLEPDAAVWEFGGTISPRGAPIRIPRTEFVAKTVEAHNQEITEGLGTLLDDLARRYAEFV